MIESPCRIGVISDTHGLFRAELRDLFAGVSMILHAGDIGGDPVRLALAEIAPLHAVCGNVDPPPDASIPYVQRLETPIGRVAMTHGHLPQTPSTDPVLMVDFFRDFAPRLILFGHSHQPYLRTHGGVVLFNPGSAGPRRFSTPASVGMITAQQGDPPFRCEHLLLDAQ